MFVIVSPIFFIVAVFLVLHARNSKLQTRVGVIVLGDIGRSPRMRQHCLSLATEGFQVQYLAVRGSTVHPDLLSNKMISISLVKPWSCLNLPKYAVLMLKPIIQFVVLMFMCCRHFWGCSAVLMQNPPTIPVVLVVWLISRIYGCKMVIDWHNYGYTILSLSLGPKHFLVKVARKIEEVFGRQAHENFCVTSAMSHDLNDNWAIKAYTLHDRPASVTKVNKETKHSLFMRLGEKYPVFRGQDANSTLFTTTSEGGGVHDRDGRPKIIVSSTSWTADEDFSILLSALTTYDKEWSKDMPSVVCVITGTGPLKSYYEDQILSLNLVHVDIVTCWLEPGDYPLLLGSADLGVSLHCSSSGLDLPMKIVDMFGAGIPVCAINFKCLAELVNHGKNGCVFDNDEQLARQLHLLFTITPNGNKKLDILRAGVKHFQALPWHYHWQRVALPIFKHDYVLKDYGDDPTPYDIEMFNMQGGRA